VTYFEPIVDKIEAVTFDSNTSQDATSAVEKGDLTPHKDPGSITESATNTETISQTTSKNTSQTTFTKRVSSSKTNFSHSSKEGNADVEVQRTVSTVHKEKQKKARENSKKGTSQPESKTVRNNDDLTVMSNDQDPIPTFAELQNEPLFNALCKVCNCHYNRYQPKHKLRFVEAMFALQESGVTEELLIGFQYRWSYYWRCEKNAGRSPYPWEILEVWDEVMDPD
jgi:hypothetical protein